IKKRSIPAAFCNPKRTYRRRTDCDGKQTAPPAQAAICRSERLLAIPGLGEICGVHSGEQAIEGGDLRDDFFVAGALEPERQRVHVGFDLGAGKLLRQNELYRHRRCIARRRSRGQEKIGKAARLRAPALPCQSERTFFANDCGRARSRAAHLEIARQSRHECKNRRNPCSSSASWRESYRSRSAPSRFCFRPVARARASRPTNSAYSTPPSPASSRPSTSSASPACFKNTGSSRKSSSSTAAPSPFRPCSRAKFSWACSAPPRRSRATCAAPISGSSPA